MVVGVGVGVTVGVGVGVVVGVGVGVGVGLTSQVADASPAGPVPQTLVAVTLQE